MNYIILKKICHLIDFNKFNDFPIHFVIEFCDKFVMPIWNCTNLQKYNLKGQEKFYPRDAQINDEYLKFLMV